MNTKRICTTAIIGALYAVLTVAVSPISYGVVQFRLSEALMVLTIFYPESIIGLTVGCFIANLFGNGWLDLVLGTSATFLACISTCFLGKKLSFAKKLILCQTFTVLFNAILVPFTFIPFVKMKNAYLLGVLTVGGGELVVVISLGTLLAITLNKRLKNLAK